MTDDIVARLRLYANASIDGEWATVFRSDLNAAADEIERLRRDYSCICSEMRRMMDERDEARREVCRLQPYAHHADGIAKDHAAYRGWDCFKEAADA